MRLAKIRVALFAMIYAAILGTVGAAIVEYLARVFGGQLFELAGQGFAMLVAFAAFLAIVGLAGLAVVNRALAILEVEIYVLGMEVVSRCVAKKDAHLPSNQYVRKK